MQAVYERNVAMYRRLVRDYGVAAEPELLELACKLGVSRIVRDLVEEQGVAVEMAHAEAMLEAVDPPLELFLFLYGKLADRGALTPDELATLLLFASPRDGRAGSAEVREFLCAQGVDVNHQLEIEGVTAPLLSHAIQRIVRFGGTSQELVSWFIRHGADINLRASPGNSGENFKFGQVASGATPALLMLMLNTTNRAEWFRRLVQEYNADLSVADEQGHNAVHYLANGLLGDSADEYGTVLDHCKEIGVDFHQRSVYSTPLELLCSPDHADRRATLLMDRGADPNVFVSTPPVFMLARCSSCELARELLSSFQEHGADLAATSSTGCNILHCVMACVRSDTAMQQFARELQQIAEPLGVSMELECAGATPRALQELWAE